VPKRWRCVPSANQRPVSARSRRRSREAYVAMLVVGCGKAIGESRNKEGRESPRPSRFSRSSSSGRNRRFTFPCFSVQASPLELSGNNCGPCPRLSRLARRGQARWPVAREPTPPALTRPRAVLVSCLSIINSHPHHQPPFRILFSVFG